MNVLKKILATASLLGLMAAGNIVANTDVAQAEKIEKVEKVEKNEIIEVLETVSAE